MAAGGKYIMFLDSDDYLSLDACERLYQAMENKQVDFIQFGTEILPGSNTPKEMVAWVENFMMPKEGLLEGNLVKFCFVDHVFNCNLVNKVWKSSICKKAYQNIEDGHYVSAEDRYATFLLSYYSGTCDAVLGQYYHYRLGVGVTGGEKLDLSQFENRCRGAVIAGKIRDFLKAKNELPCYEEEYEAFRNDILWDCVDCWYSKLQEDDKQKGYRILLEYWGAEAVVDTIARFRFEKRDEIAGKTRPVQGTTAIYYRYIGYGVMDDVLARYIKFAERHHEKIILLTDGDAPETADSYQGYPLYHIYSATNANWDQYSKRSRDLYGIIKEQKIQKVYYLSPTSHISWLDQLLIEGEDIGLKMCMDEYSIDRLNICRKEKEAAEEECARLREQYQLLSGTVWYKIGKNLKKKFKFKKGVV